MQNYYMFFHLTTPLYFNNLNTKTLQTLQIIAFSLLKQNYSSYNNDETLIFYKHLVKAFKEHITPRCNNVSFFDRIIEYLSEVLLPLLSHDIIFIKCIIFWQSKHNPDILLDIDLNYPFHN